MIPRRTLVIVPDEPVARARPTDQDIERFVARFYAEVRRDPELGPIFEARIGARWPDHLERMVDFWSSILLATGCYQGNPMEKHAAVPQIESRHYDRWLEIFESVLVRELDGHLARDVVARARRMRSALDRGPDQVGARKD
jgi:hemoglobin